MLQQGGGTIINTASVGGIRGGVAGAAYTAAKHAVVGLTKNIAAFYAPQGIRCNAICPGAVATAIGVGGEPHPEGIAKLTGDASFVNEAALVADGGWSAI